MTELALLWIGVFIGWTLRWAFIYIVHKFFSEESVMEEMIAGLRQEKLFVFQRCIEAELAKRRKVA